LYKGLIIGRLAKITESKDPSMLGRTGQIIDETKNMITLRENTGHTIRIPKSIIKISLASSKDSQQPISIIGLDLLATPEERIKG